MEIQIAHPDLADCTVYDKSMYPVSAGYYSVDLKDVFCIRSDGRADYFLFYVFKGKSRYIMNGETFYASEGDIVFYDYMDPQDYTHLAAYNTQVYWMHFNGDLARNYLKDLHFNNSLCLHTEEDLSMYFKTIIHALTHKQNQYLKIATHNIMSILLTSSHCIMKRKNANEKLDSVISLMNNPKHSKTSLSEYAKMCNLSRSQFIKLFTAHTGQTPIRYRNEILLKKAKWYLLHTSYTISEIADFLHVENVYYFSNLFKKHVGMCPTQYREKNQT